MGCMETCLMLKHDQTESEYCTRGKVQINFTQPGRTVQVQE